jgi:hypothetical protein
LRQIVERFDDGYRIRPGTRIRVLMRPSLGSPALTSPSPLDVARIDEYRRALALLGG